MKKFKIAIIDDENSIRKLYASYVEIWSHERGYTCDVAYFESGEEFLFKYEDDSNYDILLLDIEMKDMSGVDLARILRDKGDGVSIIFISGYGEYIGSGYDVEALHFLIKPINQDKLSQVLDKAVEKSDKQDHFIVVKSEETVVKLYLKDIYCIENDHNYIIISYKSNFYRVRMTMKDIENLLDDRFYRISRSEIINIEYIDNFNSEMVNLENGRVIFIPKGAFEKLNKKIISYY